MVIADVLIGENLQLRFAWDPTTTEGWRPELVMNHEALEITHPPHEFVMNTEIQRKIDRCYREFIEMEHLRLVD